MKYYPDPFIMAGSERQKITNVGEELDKGEYLTTAGRNVN